MHITMGEYGAHYHEVVAGESHEGIASLLTSTLLPFRAVENTREFGAQATQRLLRYCDAECNKRAPSSLLAWRILLRLSFDKHIAHRTIAHISTAAGLIEAAQADTSHIIQTLAAAALDWVDVMTLNTTHASRQPFVERDFVGLLIAYVLAGRKQRRIGRRTALDVLTRLIITSKTAFDQALTKAASIASFIKATALIGCLSEPEAVAATKLLGTIKRWMHKPKPKRSATDDGIEEPIDEAAAAAAVMRRRNSVAAAAVLAISDEDLLTDRKSHNRSKHDIGFGILNRPDGEYRFAANSGSSDTQGDHDRDAFDGGHNAGTRSDSRVHTASNAGTRSDSRVHTASNAATFVRSGDEGKESEHHGSLQQQQQQEEEEQPLDTDDNDDPGLDHLASEAVSRALAHAESALLAELQHMRALQAATKHAFKSMATIDAEKAAIIAASTGDVFDGIDAELAAVDRQQAALESEEADDDHGAAGRVLVADGKAPMVDSASDAGAHDAHGRHPRSEAHRQSSRSNTAASIHSLDRAGHASAVPSRPVTRGQLNSLYSGAQARTSPFNDPNGASARVATDGYSEAKESKREGRDDLDDQLHIASARPAGGGTLVHGSGSGSEYEEDLDDANKEGTVELVILPRFPLASVGPTTPQPI